MYVFHNTGVHGRITLFKFNFVLIIILIRFKHTVPGCLRSHQLSGQSVWAVCLGQ